ncbi:MAG: hypothetical protein GX061_03915 [Eubacteriaceae bacterium]|nr:hypothetical protein [Eubacteriaceae bacterium]
MPKELNTKSNKKALRLWIALLLPLLFASLSLGAVAAAKYTIEKGSDWLQAKAKNFYFTSDILSSSENVPRYQISDFVPGDGEGHSSITFELRNYEDDLRVSQIDVGYTITTDNAAVNTANNNAGGTITVAGEKATVNLIVPAGCFDSDGKALIRVTAQSSPYKKLLIAEFELFKKIDGITAAVYDAPDNNTLNLTLTTQDMGGTVTITTPAAVLPDRTDSRLTGISYDAQTGYTCTFTAAANAQYSFVFFKTSPSTVYNQTNFTIVITPPTP